MRIIERVRAVISVEGLDLVGIEGDDTYSKDMEKCESSTECNGF